MEVVWNIDQFNHSSRKRASKACRRCQQRKRKCYHHSEQAGLEPIASNAPVAVKRARRDEPLETLFSNPNSPPESVRDGDLHPESILKDLSTEPLPRQRDGNSKGESEAERSLLEFNTISKSIGTHDKQRKQRIVLSDSHKRFLTEAGAFRVLPHTTRDALLTNYMVYIDGIMPIIDGGAVLRQHGCGKASKYLIQAICLVACKFVQAGPFLRLEDEGPLLQPLEFAQALYNGLDAAMRADLEPDRQSRIQILALMHLSNDGPKGVERASANLSQAIHEAWVSSLHFLRPGHCSEDESGLLWWSLWSLDRINGCLQGSPFMIADRDIDIPRPEASTDYRSQTMTFVLKLGDLTDRVMNIYRPTSDARATGIEEDFPIFTELASNVAPDAIQGAHRDYLELWYLTMAMLSCRTSGPGSVSYRRRLDSADRIQDICCNRKHSHLLPLPLVPYAVSLSLTVAYRALKDAQRESFALYQDLTVRCEILETLSKYWWTARQMAKLARRSLKHLRQTPYEIHPQATTIFPTRSGESAHTDQTRAYDLNGRVVLTNNEPDTLIHLNGATVLVGHASGMDSTWKPSVPNHSALDDAFSAFFDLNAPNHLQDSMFAEFSSPEHDALTQGFW